MVVLNRLNDINYIDAKLEELKRLNNCFDSQYHARALEYAILTDARDKLN